MRYLSLTFAVAAYGLFVGTFAALLLFMHDAVSLSWGAGVDVCGHASVSPLVVNIGLMVLFGLQHSVMARQPFKARWQRLVPPHLERTAYVVGSCVALIVMMAYWRPMPVVVWDSRSVVVWALCVALGVVGASVLMWATFLTNHFELFGLRQAYLHCRGIAWTPVPFKTAALYKLVRHPMMLGMFAHSADRGHPFQADRGQRSGRSRTPWVRCLSDGPDGRATVRHQRGTLSAISAERGQPGYPRGALAPGG